jgi:hypothetical protein
MGRLSDGIQRGKLRVARKWRRSEEAHTIMQETQTQENAVHAAGIMTKFVH